MTRNAQCPQAPNAHWLGRGEISGREPWDKRVRLAQHEASGVHWRRGWAGLVPKRKTSPRRPLTKPPQKMGNAGWVKRGRHRHPGRKYCLFQLGGDVSSGKWVRWTTRDRRGSVRETRKKKAFGGEKVHGTHGEETIRRKRGVLF